MSKVKKMSVWELTLLVLVNMMGSGIILLPTKLASVGTISILSWVVTGGAVTCLAYAFSKCGMYSRRGGGMGGYAEYSFGKAGAFMTNYTYSITAILADVAIALTAVAYALQVAGIEANATTICVGTLIAIWLATVCSLGGPKSVGRITSFTVLGAIIPVVGISIIGWFWFSPSLWAASWNPHNLPAFQAISESIALTLWAFAGFESAVSNSDAVENPEKNVPIAVLGATIIAAAVYVVSTNVVQGIVPGADLVNSNAPFGVAYARMFTPAVGQVFNAFFVVSCFGSLMACQFTAVQCLKSGADAGYFPQIFAKELKNGLPLMDMIIVAIIQSVFVIMSASPTFFEQFEAAVDLSVMTNIIPFIYSMGALVVIQKASLKGKTAIATNICAIIGLIYCFYALYSCGEQAMVWGSLVTFLGVALYGLVSPKFDLESAKEFNDKVDAEKASNA